MVLAPTNGPVMVVRSPSPEVMVTVLVVAGGITVVMKCAEHSSAPAGFQYTAASCQYISSLGMVGMCFPGPLTSITIVFDTSGIHTTEHHYSGQNYGQF